MLFEAGKREGWIQRDTAEKFNLLNKAKAYKYANCPAKDLFILEDADQ